MPAVRAEKQAQVRMCLQNGLVYECAMRTVPASLWCHVPYNNTRLCIKIIPE